VQLSFNPKTDLKQAFATPIGLFQLPNAGELAPKIANVVLARKKRMLELCEAILVAGTQIKIFSDGRNYSLLILPIPAVLQFHT